MEKTYQPEVIELSDKMINTLKDDGFFEESGITDHTPANGVLRDFLTEKFIEGKLTDGVVEVGDEEFMNVLSMIIAKCTLTSLVEKGYVNSVEDENDEEVFFLTEKGKQYKKDNLE